MSKVNIDEATCQNVFEDKQVASQTHQRRCTFYNIPREHCEFISVHSQNCKNENHLGNKQLPARIFLTLKKGKNVRCSHCGSIMYRYGFTTYDKQVFDLVNNKKEVFCSQRIRCSNPGCTDKNSSGNNVVHIVLPSDVIPREELYFFELVDLSLCCEEFGKETVKIKQSHKRITIRHIETAISKNRKLRLLKSRYGSSFPFFFKKYVNSQKGLVLYAAYLKLKSFEQAASISSELTVKNITGQSYTGTVLSSKLTPSFPNILKKNLLLFCQEFIHIAY